MVKELEWEMGGFTISIWSALGRYPRRCVVAQKGSFKHSEFVDNSVWVAHKNGNTWIPDFIKRSTELFNNQQS